MQQSASAECDLPNDAIQTQMALVKLGDFTCKLFCSLFASSRSDVSLHDHAGSRTLVVIWLLTVVLQHAATAP